MKSTQVLTTTANASDALISRAISYLDSGTDYRECLPDRETMGPLSQRTSERELVLVPVLLIGALILVAVLM